jgi:hypothetical protein
VLARLEAVGMRFPPSTRTLGQTKLVHSIIEMPQEQAVAAISSDNRRVLVEVTLTDPELTISRSFHAICDAERWLAKLVGIGLSKTECKCLIDKTIVPFALPPLGPIRIVDKRLSKRFELPEIFS